MRPIPIANRDHTSEELEQTARNCKDLRWARRLRAVAMVLRGTPRGDAAEAHGLDVQTPRDWVERYNRDGPEGLRMPPAGGRPRRLEPWQPDTLVRHIEAGPEPGADARPACVFATLRRGSWMPLASGTRWTGCASCCCGWASGTLSPRPFHPRADLAAQDDFRNNFSELVEEAAGDATGPIEIRVQDESRAGQQGMLSRVWARKGTRPRIPRDRRFRNCYLVSAACPARKQAVGHICERADTTEMKRHLEDISEQVSPGSHAVVVLDGAGWHKARDPAIPNNISLLFLPPTAPRSTRWRTCSSS